jgi:hypothetical protein
MADDRSAAALSVGDRDPGLAEFLDKSALDGPVIKVISL